MAKAKHVPIRFGDRVRFYPGVLPDTILVGEVVGIVRNIGHWWYNIKTDDGTLHLEQRADKVTKVT